MGRYLALLAVLLLAACAGGQASSPTQEAEPTTAPSESGSALDTADPPADAPAPSPSSPPIIDLSSSFAQQGGFLLVRLLSPPPGLSQASIEFAGGSYPMLPELDRWYAFIGLATDFAPGDHVLQVRGDGEPLAAAVVGVAAGGFGQEYVELPPESAGLLADAAAIEQERRALASVYAAFTPQRLWSGAWLLPAAGPITNPFGLQRSINGGPFSPHTGTDIAAEAGAVVVAAAGGRVAFAGPLYLRGNSVVLDHGAGVFSGYHHLSALAVSEGQAVNQGDLLGYVGATGLVSGAHLHWEAIVGGVRVDPTLWTYGPVEP